MKFQAHKTDDDDITIILVLAEPAVHCSLGKAGLESMPSLIDRRSTNLTIQ
jgi:hypothetical protein